MSVDAISTNNGPPKSKRDVATARFVTSDLEAPFGPVLTGMPNNYE